jgi:hypothetical protein
MYCPQCGQQQVSEVIRFCSRCGFPLEGANQLLANGGLLPAYQSTDDARKMSPRKRGVVQGGILFLSGVVVVPILGVLDSFTRLPLDMLVALAAILCFVGGPIRMLIAALFEEGAKRPSISTTYLPPGAPVQVGPAPRGAALPPPSINIASGWRRPNTAELVQPPSVTENTTRLLNKDTDKQDQ